MAAAFETETRSRPLDEVSQGSIGPGEPEATTAASACPPSGRRVDRSPLNNTQRSEPHRERQPERGPRNGRTRRIVTRSGLDPAHPYEVIKASAAA